MSTSNDLHPVVPLYRGRLRLVLVRPLTLPLFI